MPSAKRNNPAPAKETIPLTTAQKRLLEDVLPLVRGIARQVARQWDADGEELEQQAIHYAAAAAREFDSRGNLPAFVGQRVRQRLLDWMKYEYRRRRVRSPLAYLRTERRRKSHRNVAESLHEAGDRFAIHDDPSRRLRFAEAVAALRHCLSPREIEILRLAASGMTAEKIACRLSITPRWLRVLRSDMRDRIEHEARDSGFCSIELQKALLRDDPSARVRLVALLGRQGEEILKN